MQTFHASVCKYLFATIAKISAFSTRDDVQIIHSTSVSRIELVFASSFQEEKTKNILERQQELMRN
jgi:hypothetical protein